MSVQTLKFRFSGAHIDCAEKEDELIAIQERMNCLVDQSLGEMSPIHNDPHDSMVFLDLANQETRIINELARTRRACSTCSGYQLLLDSDPRFDR